MSNFLEEVKWFFGQFGGLILITSVVMVLILAGLNSLQRTTCYAKTNGMGFPVQYGFFSGCLIQVEGDKWIPLDNYYYKQP